MLRKQGDEEGRVTFRGAKVFPDATDAMGGAQGDEGERTGMVGE